MHYKPGIVTETVDSLNILHETFLKATLHMLSSAVWYFLHIVFLQKFCASITATNKMKIKSDFKTFTWYKWNPPPQRLHSLFILACIKWNFIKPSSIICQCCKIIRLKTPWNELPKPEYQIKSPAELAVCLEVILFNMQLYLMILTASQRYRKLCRVPAHCKCCVQQYLISAAQSTFPGQWKRY